MTPGEARIRKQSKLLAKRLLKEDGDESVPLVVMLLKRSRCPDTDPVLVARENYAFLLKNDVSERVAWDVTGMGDI